MISSLDSSSFFFSFVFFFSREIRLSAAKRKFMYGNGLLPRFSASVPYKFWKRRMFDDLVRGTDLSSFKSSNGNKNTLSWKTRRLQITKTIRNLHIRSCPLAKLSTSPGNSFVEHAPLKQIVCLRLLIKAIKKGIAAINNIQSKALYIKR